MKRSPLIQDGLRHVRRKWGWRVSESNIFSREKFEPYPRARWYLCAYIRAARPDWSLPRIAKAMGWDCHTSVLWALRRAYGYDGKLEAKHPPLWTKEHFEKLVADDEVRAIRNGDKVWERAA